MLFFLLIYFDNQFFYQVAALVHHTYDLPTDASYLSYVNNIKSRFPGKATWMSVRARGTHVPFMLNFVKEICCSLGSANGAGRGWSGGYDPTIGNALMSQDWCFRASSSRANHITMYVFGFFGLQALMRM
jgi:hypothetical protein